MAAAFVLNRSLVLSRLGGDEEILSLMVEMYLQDVDNNCAALAAAASGGDAPTMQREAHTIKGLLATLSDDAGSAEALQLEMKAKQGDMRDAVAAVAVLQARLREVAEVLRQI